MPGLQAARGAGALTNAPVSPAEGHHVVVDSERISGIYPRMLLTALIVIVFDQITKTLALNALDDGPIEVIDGVLSLRLTFNPGGAFGILQGIPEFFLVATVLVVVLVLFWARKLTETSWTIPLGLVLGGGIGNVIDRVVRDTDGRVVDFVDLHVWPVFNVADSCIVLGVLLLIFMSARAPKHPPG